MKLSINWHFIADEIDDLPGGFAAPPSFPGAGLPGFPAKGDLISFTELPDALFMVDFRRFEFSRDASQPLSLHVHLIRLRKNAA